MKCSTISTGAILLADIIPSLIAKMLTPFLLHSISYSVRHAFVLLFQCVSFILVAFSTDFFMSILGVIFASAGSGLGEVSYLSLTLHFPSDVVSSWASGTGGAGIVGALAFAVLTDRHLIGLSPRSALLIMLIVPLILFCTFWKILVFPSTVHNFNIWRVTTYFISRPISRRRLSQTSTEPARSLDSDVDEQINEELTHRENTPLFSGFISRSYVSEDAVVTVRSFRGKAMAYLRLRLCIIGPLLKYMIPLTIVYYAEYFINQGLLELLDFTCSQGFRLSPTSQYRWYQVLYQVGVFVSRSSAKFFPLNPLFLPILPFLQMINAIFLFNKAMHPPTGHILFVFCLVFYEGLLGGAAYVNTFNTMHKTIQFHREFSISFVALSDAAGIAVAGFTGIWAHNYICSQSRLLHVYI